MDLISFYKSVLSVANLTADAQGFVNATYGEKATPLMISGKRLILPTHENLRNFNHETCVAFHPLVESNLRGESDVLSKLRGLINLRLHYVITELTNSLLWIATSPAEHHKLSPDQAGLLEATKDADEKSLAFFSDIVKQMAASDREKCFVNIFLRRSATVSGKSYNRAAIISFPFFEELKKDEKTVFGVKVRKKDVTTFISLFKFMFPNIEDAGSYNYGTSSDIAPNLVALMKGLLKVVTPIQDLISNYEKFITDVKSFSYKDEWVDVIDNLSSLMPEVVAIPMMPGNEGTAIDKGRLAVEPESRTTQLPWKNNTPHQNNFQNQQPSVSNGPVLTASGKIDFASTMRQRGNNNNNNFGGFYQNVDGPDSARSAPLRYMVENQIGFQGNQQFGQAPIWPNNQNGFGGI